ncbi:hypothetical protein [Streptomyces sp. NPDC047065]|uniref:hypothetical protein n=1 Tax=Streptomyces sp. NPDC047065 TaxID=3154606 RepID=UPI0034119E8F
MTPKTKEPGKEPNPPLPSPSLTLRREQADYDVPDLLPPALDELGLTLHPAGSRAAREAGVRALAARTPAGELTPRELAFRIHQRFGHGLPMTERLAELDDEYDYLEYGDGTLAQVDADVLAEALRITAAARPLA